MHTRRVGAFLIGGWLLGTFIMFFVTTQSIVNVERIINSPPQAVTKEFEDLGSEVIRQILKYESLQLNRHLTEAWEVMQLGIGGALLATSFLTTHRSRVVIVGTLMMLGIVLYMYFSLTPTMVQLERSYDFLPAGAAQRERDNHAGFAVWDRVLEILKTGIGAIIAARLLFDRYDWKNKLVGTPAPEPASGRIRRRRRSASAGSKIEEVDSVDNANDSHVDR